MSIKTVVFPVAGLGTRFLPVTKTIPKEMLPILGKPLIQYAVEEARAAGIENFVFVHSRGKHVLEDHFDVYPALEEAVARKGNGRLVAALRGASIDTGQSVFVRQSNPLGLGHAVWCARRYVGDKPFAVVLPDDVIMGEPGCLAQMIDAYESIGGAMVASMTVAPEETSKYGVLDIKRRDGPIAHLRGMVEKPKPEAAPSTSAVIGRYILPPSIFTMLEGARPTAGGEIQLTDAIAALIGREPVSGFAFRGQRFDCGSIEGYVAANVAYAMADDTLRAAVAPLIMQQFQTPPLRKIA